MSKWAFAGLSQYGKCHGTYVRTSCPLHSSWSKKVGYEFTEGLYSNGHGLVHLKGKKLDQIRVECDKRFECVAFRDDGWLLRDLAPDDKWIVPRVANALAKCSGTYVRNTPVCDKQYAFAKKTGYGLTEGYYSHKHGIVHLKGKTVAQLSTECSKRMNCVAFRSDGWLLSDVLPENKWLFVGLSAYAKCAGTYTRNTPDCSKVVQYAESRGYELTVGYFSHNHGIVRLKGKTVAQLEAECRKRWNCAGFRTDGWLLSDLIPMSKWAFAGLSQYGKCHGTYVRTSCPLHSSWSKKVGYEFTEGLYSNGHGLVHLKGKKLDQIRVECDKRFECVAFRDDGWLLRDLAPDDKWIVPRVANALAKCSGTYVRNTPVCDKQYAFAKKTGYGLTEGYYSHKHGIVHLKGKTVAQLSTECSKRMNCVAFRSDGWLLSDVLPENKWLFVGLSAYTKCAGTYTRNTPDCSSLEGLSKKSGYELTPGYYSNNHGIVNLKGKSVQQLFGECSKRDNCIAFRTDGWLLSDLQTDNKWTFVGVARYNKCFGTFVRLSTA